MEYNKAFLEKVFSGKRMERYYQEMITVMGWMNKDVPGWLQQTDRFDAVCRQIRKTMQWE